MSFKGAIINKLNGGLGNSNPTDDSVFLLAVVVPLASLPSGVTHYDDITCYSIDNLEDAGFNESLDANSQLLVHHHVEEVFRLAPDCILHVVPVPDALKPSEILTQAPFLTTLRAASTVKVIGIAGTSLDITGIVADVEAVQAFVDGQAAAHRFIDAVVLEGKGAATALTIANYPDLRSKAAGNVSVVIAQDPYIAGLDAAYAKYAAVGSALGMGAVRQVNENWGSVNILNKPSARKGEQDYKLTQSDYWNSAALSDGKDVSALSFGEKAALTDKGYIYAGSYDGYAGVFLNDSPTCVSASSDYSYIENNRVWNKAARLIYATLIPLVKSRVKKDPTTGYIKSTSIAAFNASLNAALETMVSADEISGYDFYIDPKQILNNTNKSLKIKAQVVKDDIIHEFEVDLGFALSV